MANKGPYSQGYGLSSSHVRMWELDNKEGRAPKNWHFQTVCWRRLLRVPWKARRSNQLIVLFIYFNWRLITLQYCSGFCHTLTWISHGCTCVPHPEPPLPRPSPSHPSKSSQCTSPEHPVSCIEPGLAIYFIYGNIHVSMLFSQIIPPLPSPTESKSLFFTSLSLLLSRI